VDNVTFFDFLLFSMCYSLHVGVNICINYSFFTFISFYSWRENVAVLQ